MAGQEVFHDINGSIYTLDADHHNQWIMENGVKVDRYYHPGVGMTLWDLTGKPTFGEVVDTVVNTPDWFPVPQLKFGSLIPKIGSFIKGMGNALVKDTGSISKNTTNLRTWAKENGWVQQNSSGGVEQWGVKNADGTFSWRLKIKPEASTREGLGTGSNQPRFDARLDDKGTYINPFTGETGGRNVGTHIPLGK